VVKRIITVCGLAGLILAAGSRTHASIAVVDVRNFSNTPGPAGCRYFLRQGADNSWSLSICSITNSLFTELADGPIDVFIDIDSLNTREIGWALPTGRVSVGPYGLNE